MQYVLALFSLSDQNEGNPIAGVLLPDKTPIKYDTKKNSFDIKTKWIFRINLLK